MHDDSIYDIIANAYNFNGISIEVDTIKSSVGFIESGWSRSNLIYFAPRCPSTCCCINEYLAIYSGVEIPIALYLQPG